MATAASQAVGVKFRRQQGIGRYIVDFYSPAHKLVIELDGDSHSSEEAQVYDRQRDSAMRALGLRVLRLTNKDVMDNMEGVLEYILREIEGE